MKMIIEFEGKFAEISMEMLAEKFFDVEFEGSLRVQFAKINSEWTAVNGSINVFGRAVFILPVVEGKKAFIYRQVIT